MQSKVCKKCGYCDECGRGGGWSRWGTYPTLIPYPYYQQPWVQPYTYQAPWYSQSGSLTTTGVTTYSINN